MKLDLTQLESIACRARRLQYYFNPHRTEDRKGPVEIESATLERIERWRQTVADGDQVLFEKRLASAGVRTPQLPSIFSQEPIGAEDLPEWTARLQFIVESYESANFSMEQTDLAKNGFLQADKPLPFEHLFVPIVIAARDRTQEQIFATKHLISDDAIIDLQRLLLVRLSEDFSRILEAEFGSFLALLQLEGLDYRAITSNTQSSVYYCKFMQSLFDGGLANLCEKYPVFSYHIVHRVDQWVEIVTEFLQRIFEDIDAIADELDITKSSVIAHLKPGLSDPHDNGRTVIVVEFESGEKIVYKPKSLGPDACYFRIAQWFNSSGTPYDFKILKVVERPNYGYIQFAPHQPMRSVEEASRFYERSGSLLALLYAFDGIDFHYQNVIACGECPTPIDFETIVHHQVRLTGELNVDVNAASLAIAQSVLKTHFLPQLYEVRSRYVDLTGMGAGNYSEIAIEALSWININTDAMVCRTAQIKPSFDTEHAPMIEDTRITPEDYAQEIVQGFSDTYRFIWENRDRLLDPASVFMTMFKQPVRFLHRATSVYSSVRQRIAHPSFQKNGVDFGIELEAMYRPFLPLNERPPLWAIIDEEIDALYRLDVPKFTAFADDDSLTLADGTRIAKCFDGSPRSNTIRKMLGFSESDLAFQCDLIKTALAFHSYTTIVKDISRFDEKGVVQSAPILEQAQLLDLAGELADEIQEKAMRSETGEASWMTIVPANEEKQFFIDSMKHDLYTGNVGVGLFFAALERCVPARGYGDFVYTAINLTRRWVKKARPGDIEALGLGGFMGLGSVIYGLHAISALLEDPNLREEATFAADLISEKLIMSDNRLDMVSGSAGAATALLALFRSSRDSDILQRAIHCGQHLLKKRDDIGDGFRGWKSADGPALTGFSHGAAGYAYTLLSLYRETDNTDFLDAAKEVIAYEDSQYDAEVCNWKDLRRDPTKPEDDESDQFIWAWCNGAPGIALSRSATLNVLDNATIRSQINDSLNATIACSHLRADHLCCGSSSRGEILLSAGEYCKNSQWEASAREIISQAVHRHTSDGAYVPVFLFDFFSPTLFQGTAGLGYHLLRLADVEKLPNILLLE